MKKIAKHLVTEVFISGLKKNADTFPEYSHAKETNYYIFGDKVESYTIKHKTTEYMRTTRVDKVERMCAIVEKLLAESQSFFLQRSQVDIIVKVFPMIFETVTGKCIEPDFSENLALKFKFSV